MAYELNQATFEDAIEMASDKVIVQGNDLTVPVTTTFATITQFEEAISGELSTAVAGGIITAGRAGKAVISIDGSFESDSAGAPVVDIHFFHNDTTDTEYGVERSISQQASVGSFSGSHAITLAVTDTLRLKVKRTGGTDGDLIFHYLTLKLEWQA